MREFLLRRRDWNTQRDRDRFRVLSVYIYIEGTCQRERDLFFYLVLNFTLIRFFLIQSVFFFFLILILMCVFLILQFAHISTLIYCPPWLQAFIIILIFLLVLVYLFHSSTYFLLFFLSYRISFYFIF